jgi:hypothetical protein
MGFFILKITITNNTLVKRFPVFENNHLFVSINIALNDNILIIIQ